MTKILIVDDSDALRATVEELLVDAGYEILQAADGHEGLFLALAKNDLDLVIADFNMPGIDGITMCQTIRERQANWQVPVIMLTTEGLRSIKEIGKSAGVVAWIMKPYDNDKFLSIIKKILDRERLKLSS